MIRRMLAVLVCACCPGCNLSTHLEIENGVRVPVRIEYAEYYDQTHASTVFAGTLAPDGRLVLDVERRRAGDHTAVRFGTSDGVVDFEQRIETWGETSLKVTETDGRLGVVQLRTPRP